MVILSARASVAPPVTVVAACRHHGRAGALRRCQPGVAL